MGLIIYKWITRYIFLYIHANKRILLMSVYFLTPKTNNSKTNNRRLLFPWKNTWNIFFICYYYCCAHVLSYRHWQNGTSIINSTSIEGKKKTHEGSVLYCYCIWLKYSCVKICKECLMFWRRVCVMLLYIDLTNTKAFVKRTLSLG